MKRLSGVICLVVLMSALLLPAGVAGADSRPVVYLDGERLEFDVPPVIVDGTTLVPLRGIFEAFGTQMEWDNESKTVTAVRGGLELKYTIGESAAYMNTHRVELASTPGMIREGRVLVPLRFVGEALGTDVRYEAGTRSVIIRSRVDSSPERYRMTLPYHSILRDAPFLVAYMNEIVDERGFEPSYVFFGDSLTWGAHLGRAEAHPALLRDTFQAPSFNLGVPGFSADHLVSFLPWALRENEQSAVIIQLQYFNAESGPYTGMEEMLAAPMPGYEEAVRRIRQDLRFDQDEAIPPMPSYEELDDALREERIQRGKSLFVPGEVLEPAYRNTLAELREFMVSRPEQDFYVYLPPYYLEEVYRRTGMTEADYRRRSGEILSVFGEAPNVRVLDFNEWNDTWRPEHFIDWWHRTVDGERQFAEVMAKWLSGEL